MNVANETLLGGEGIDRAIHEVAQPGLLDECCKVNVCEIGECKVTSGYKLPANYVFHAVGLRDKNKDKLKECYESCLQKVSLNNINCILLCTNWYSWV